MSGGGGDLALVAPWAEHVVRCAAGRGHEVRLELRAGGTAEGACGQVFSQFRYADFGGLVAEDDSLVLQSPRGTVRVSPGGDEVVVEGAADGPIAQWPEVGLALVEALRRQGLCHLHAAAVARDGDCVVVLGPSGAGKTTTMLQFLRAGWDLVADDSVFLYPGPLSGEVECIGWPDPVRLTPWLAARAPELEGALEPEADGKLRAAGALAERRSDWATPRTLWLLEPGDRGQRSRLRRLRGTEAFCALVPLSPLLMTARGHADAHAGLLARLLGQARVLGASLGEDLLEPGCVEDLWAGGEERGE